MKKETAQKLGFWVAIGMILGTAAGVLLGNVGVGIAIGIVLGAAIGRVLADNVTFSRWFSRTVLGRKDLEDE